MRIVVAATAEQWDEFTCCTDTIEWIKTNDERDFLLFPDADAYFNLTNNRLIDDYAILNKPVFIHAVSITLLEMRTPANVFRFNGWAGFLKRQVWELAGIPDEKTVTVFNQMGKKFIMVGDEPGLGAARIISMIINEAFFTVGDGVCSREEIDIAMKLGTNYPLGPFEWTTRIGAENILDLLQKLTLTDKRYQPAPLLVQEAGEKRS